MSLFRTTRRLIHTSPDSIRYDYDTVIVGGGIVGISTARIMKMQNPSMKIGILEKESALCQHQSSHNSGVIHCGIYYKPGSLKAELCVKGSRQTYEYCKEKGIKHRNDGKLIVAINSSEISRLINLYENGLKNNVSDLKLLETPSEIKAIEPLCDGGLKAIWCGSTGIVDFSQIADHYASDFKSLGGDIHLSCEVTNFSGINRMRSKDFVNGIQVQYKDTTKDDNDLSQWKTLNTKHVITCCGAYSDRVSQMSGSSKYPIQIPIRGDYLKIKNKRLNSKFNGANIYPVPDPKFPVLGVHFTPMFNKESGEIEYILGPSSVFALGRENYGFRDMNMSDTLDTIKETGFWKMVGQNWQFGLDQMRRNTMYKLQVDELKKYVSELEYEDVERSFGGIRAQSMDAVGNLTDDFCIDTKCVDAINSEGRFLNVRNAPSPACTSSMAIGELIVEKATESFNLGAYKTAF